jgi:hypothetical protein
VKTVKKNTTRPKAKDIIEKDLFALYIMTPFKKLNCDYLQFPIGAV